MHNLNEMMREHQTISSWRTVYMLTDLQKCLENMKEKAWKISWKTRKIEGLSQIRGDYRHKTIKSTWSPGKAKQNKTKLVYQMVTLANVF